MICLLDLLTGLYDDILESVLSGWLPLRLPQRLLKDPFPMVLSDLLGWLMLIRKESSILLEADFEAK